MQTRPFGNGGPAVPVVGQGTWELERSDPRSVIRTLRAGLDRGMTHVDTAEMYGHGACERLVGEALAGRRDEAFLVSKVLPGNASRRGTLEACERSLSRLGTGHLDAYLLHWPGPHPLEETVAAFEDLVQGGKILRWGVSNFDAAEIGELTALCGADRVACNQVIYHLRERAVEHAVIPACREAGIAVVAYSPFGSGRFPDPASAGGRVLEEIARGRGCTPRQVALAYLTRLPGLFTIPRTARAEHAAENARAGDLVLEAAEVDRIGRTFPRGPEPRALPML